MKTYFFNLGVLYIKWRQMFVSFLQLRSSKMFFFKCKDFVA
jgi:hypothetical protein